MIVSSAVGLSNMYIRICIIIIYINNSNNLILLLIIIIITQSVPSGTDVDLKLGLQQK